MLEVLFVFSRLRLLKQERIKDYLLMEEEFIRNQERLKPQDEKNEEERSKVTFFMRHYTTIDLNYCSSL